MQTVNRLQLTTLHYSCGHELSIKIPLGADAQLRKVSAVCVCPACLVCGNMKKKGKENDDTRQQPRRAGGRHEQTTLF